MESGLQIFDLDGVHGSGVATLLGLPLSRHEERRFEDGEHKLRPLEAVRAADVYVLATLGGAAESSPNDRLCRLLFFLATLRDCGAARVTAVVPYLCYARKDRRTKPRDPLTSRYVAMLFEAMGPDRLVTLDVHNLAAYQNAFRMANEHLEARRLFAQHLLPRLGTVEPVVVSPDAGGVKRAERLRELLAAGLGREVPLAFLEKRRSSGVVSGEAVVGEVEGRTALIVDDMISGGTTILRATAACRSRGAASVCALATHGLLFAGAERLFGAEGPEELVLTDSVKPASLPRTLPPGRLTVLPIVPLLAEAVRRLHEGGSLVELLEG